MIQIEKIKRILNILADGMNDEEFNASKTSYEALEISVPMWKKLMIMLQEEGLVEGVEIAYFVDGTVGINTENIRISLKGLEYLESKQSVS